MNSVIYLSSNPAALSAALSVHSITATVEAEYGETVVEGIVTLAHHGPRSANPAPCLAANGICKDVEREVGIGISHFDLDTLGGCAAIMGIKPEASGFWQLAAFIDVNGPHKLSQSGASEEDIRRLYAYWAWSEKNRVMPPRDGSVAMVTSDVVAGIKAIEAIIAGDEGMLKAGDAFRQAEEELNKSSFVEACGDVVVRVAKGFTNHLYVTPSGKIGKAVVAIKTEYHSCSVSLADPIPGVSCCSIVQSIWLDKDENGKFLAGGHAGISGSPRGKFCGLDSLTKLRDATIAAIQAAMRAAEETRRQEEIRRMVKVVDWT